MELPEDVVGKLLLTIKTICGMIRADGERGMVNKIDRELYRLRYRTGVVLLERKGVTIAMGVVWSAQRDIRRAINETGADGFVFKPDDAPEFRLAEYRQAWPGMKIWDGAIDKVRLRSLYPEKYPWMKRR